MKVRNVTINIKMTIEYGDMEVPENVFKELNHNVGREYDETDIQCGDLSQESNDWISQNIKFRDASEFSYEIEEFE